VIGDREVESNSVAVRSADGKDLGIMSKTEFLNLLESDISSKGFI
jgi:threonyl-tRNA synthetase